MNKIDWKRKLTSRKFWMAIAAFITALVMAFGGTKEQTTQITALIMAGATAIAYIIGEGLTDAAGAKNADNTQSDDEPTEKKEETQPPEDAD